MSGTRHQGRTAAVGSLKGPSPERAATTGLRRNRPFGGTSGTEVSQRSSADTSLIVPIEDL